MSEKEEFNNSAKGIAFSLMIVGAVLGVSYFFTHGAWQEAVLYSQSWLVAALAVIFFILAIHKVEVRMNIFLSSVFFVAGLGGFYILFS